LGEDSDVEGEGPKQRLFLAVEVPGSARQVVDAAIRPWRDSFPNARWVPPENWHVTLKFLGWTSSRLAQRVGETVGGIVAVHAPITSRLRGLGAFPSHGRARVLWAGIDDPSSNLSAVVADLEEGLAEEFRPEMRRFHAHLTVARSEPPLRLPASYAATPLLSDPFVADRVVLFRSHLEAGSTTYEPLRTFALGG
jgi:RNA 2',3'-cyclic 3'-phosphodiesterase